MKFIPLVVVLLAICEIATSGPAAVESAAKQIHAAAGDAPVILLGEKHRQPESPPLARALADRLTAGGDCLVVALEITSDQQPVLDALEQDGSPGAVAIHPIIDHPALRTLLVDLADLTRSGRCLDLAAVDAPPDAPQGRDEWMTDQFVELLRYRERRVLALLGNLHTLQRLTWTAGEDWPFVAESLIRRGVTVFSVAQRWPPGPDGCEARTGSWYAIEEGPAVEAAYRTLQIVAVERPDFVTDVIDGAVLWTCTEPEREP